ncbi:MAG: exodeoxyribonuclease large subunit [Pseudomonadota bacterium]
MDTSSPLLSVGDLNRAIAESLTERFDAVLVSGEISNFKAYDSGHWYFSLKDEEGQIRCVMFRGKNAQLGFMPQSGDQVEVAASVSMYVPRGDVQLTIHSLRKAGLGGLYEAFLKLKEKLAKAGLFDENRKRPIPSHPKSLAIITSAQAAALKDVLTTLARRAPHIPIFIYPTLVQGPDAPAGIIHALKQANQDRLGEVILLVRGGGSIEDLWAFNDEALANAIASSSIPVISGVGHETDFETDFTIADFVSDLRAPTPTGAAELATPKREQLLQELRTYQEELRQKLEQRIEREAQTLDQISLRLGHALPNPERMREQIGQWQQRLVQSAHVYFNNLKHNQAHWLRQLETLNPQRTLERGYAVILDQHKKAARKPNDIKADQEYLVRLAEGEVKTRFLTSSTK